MASNTFVQSYSDGTSKRLRRRINQGRKPSGLGRPKLIRLRLEDEKKMNDLRLVFGVYWNENEFVRSAVSDKLSNSVYTELLKH